MALMETPEEIARHAQDAADAAQAAATSAQHWADVAHGYAMQLGDTAGGIVHAVSGGTIDPFVFRLAIFAMAVFVGYYVVWSVTPALHTPLMSVTNAISSVIVVGALLLIGVEITPGHEAGEWAARIFGFIALILATVNIFGGFLVTERMLAMYKKKG